MWPGELIMKATPKFTGRWYGIEVHEGVEFNVPSRLQAKVASQPDRFMVKKRRGRPDG